MQEKQYRICLVLPCYKRPARTRRIIKDILQQTITNWEAFIIGDGCPDFQSMIDSGEAQEFINEAELKGSKIHCYNLDFHYGGCGYEVINLAVRENKSRYFIFSGNDDTLMPNHFEHYLSEIENTDLDMVYYNTYLSPLGTIRYPELGPGGIGHSEIIVNSDIIREYSHSPDYGHDWEMISYILAKTDKVKKASSTEYSYLVNHLLNIGTIDSID